MTGQEKTLPVGGKKQGRGSWSGRMRLQDSGSPEENGVRTGEWKGFPLIPLLQNRKQRKSLFRRSKRKKNHLSSILAVERIFRPGQKRRKKLQEQNQSFPPGKSPGKRAEAKWPQRLPEWLLLLRQMLRSQRKLIGSRPCPF